MNSIGWNKIRETDGLWEKLKNGDFVHRTSGTEIQTPDHSSSNPYSRQLSCQAKWSLNLI